MNLPRSQFSLKADLLIGFPYRFNTSFSTYFHSGSVALSCREICPLLMYPSNSYVLINNENTSSCE